MVFFSDGSVSSRMKQLRIIVMKPSVAAARQGSKNGLQSTCGKILNILQKIAGSLHPDAHNLK